MSLNLVTGVTSLVTTPNEKTLLLHFFLAYHLVARSASWRRYRYERHHLPTPTTADGGYGKESEAR